MSFPNPPIPSPSSPAPADAPAIYVGMDGGGTKTTLLARTAGAPTPLARTGPGVNPQRFTLETACTRLAAMLRAVRDDLAPGAPLRVYAGLAGAGRPEDQHEIARRVAEHLGGDVRMHVTHDAEIALDAAFPDASGAIIISGTGSVLLARETDGTRHRVGGWGYLLGDEGSGTLLGLEAVRAICRALDGGPPTTLVALGADAHGLVSQDAIIEKVYRSGWSYQSGARLILDAAAAGDEVARTILREQTERLAAQLGFLAARHPGVARRYVLMGGLNNERVYREALVAAIRARLPAWEGVTLALDPTEAALRGAERFSWPSA